MVSRLFEGPELSDPSRCLPRRVRERIMGVTQASDLGPAARLSGGASVVMQRALKES